MGAIISVGTCAPVDVHLIHPPSKTTSYQSYTSGLIQSAYFLFKEPFDHFTFDIKARLIIIVIPMIFN